VVWLKRKASRYAEQYPLGRPEQRIPPWITSVVSLYPLLFSICDHFSLLIARLKKIRLKKRCSLDPVPLYFRNRYIRSGALHPTERIYCEVVNRASAGCTFFLVGLFSLGLFTFAEQHTISFTVGR